MTEIRDGRVASLSDSVMQMTDHEDPQACFGSIEYDDDDWRTITFGAYRYGECSVCGRTFREYYSFEQVETPEVLNEEEEPVAVYQR